MKLENNMNLFVKYLTNSISENEKIVFEKWLSESPENKKQFITIKKYWETTGKAFDSYEPNFENAWKNVYENTLGKVIVRKNEKRLRSRKLIGIAAVILMLLSLGITGIFIHNKIQDNNSKLLTYSSGKKIKEISLVDGSTVWLNKNSELKVMPNYIKRNRKVKLSGEAFFYVAKNHEKPFIIKTNRTITKVIGTSFNIKETRNNIILTVIKGKVAFYEVYKKSKGINITQGEKATYSKTTRLINSSNNTNLNYLSWKTGKIEFKNTPLKMVCEQLSDIYGKKIIYFSNSANEHSITGNFTNAPLEEILEVIELTINVKFNIEGEKIILNN